MAEIRNTQLTIAKLISGSARSISEVGTPLEELFRSGKNVAPDTVVKMSESFNLAGIWLYSTADAIRRREYRIPEDVGYVAVQSLRNSLVTNAFKASAAHLSRNAYNDADSSMQSKDLGEKFLKIDKAVANLYNCMAGGTMHDFNNPRPTITEKQWKIFSDALFKAWEAFREMGSYTFKSLYRN